MLAISASSASSCASSCAASACASAWLLWWAAPYSVIKLARLIRRSYSLYSAFEIVFQTPILADLMVEAVACQTRLFQCGYYTAVGCVCNALQSAWNVVTLLVAQMCYNI